MNPRIFSKIWIIIILIVFIAGGIFAWQYFGKQGEEPKKSEVVKNETADWRTYSNEEFGFEFEYPEDWAYQVSPKGSRQIFFYPRSEGLFPGDVFHIVISILDGVEVPLLPTFPFESEHFQRNLVQSEMKKNNRSLRTFPRQSAMR